MTLVAVPSTSQLKQRKTRNICLHAGSPGKQPVENTYHRDSLDRLTQQGLVAQYQLCASSFQPRTPILPSSLGHPFLNALKFRDHVLQRTLCENLCHITQDSTRLTSKSASSVGSWVNTAAEPLLGRTVGTHPPSRHLGNVLTSLMST